MYDFLTDPLGLGIVAWAGIIITILGLAIVIDQIRRTKTAAEGAAAGAKALVKEVQTRERLLELNSAAALIGNAKDYLTQRNFPHALIFLDLAFPQCAQVRELLRGADQQRMLLVVIRMKGLYESIARADSNELREAQAIPLAIEAREIISEMNALAAKLRYRYNQERV